MDSVYTTTSKTLNSAKGKKAEAVAERYLIDNKYKILEKNFKTIIGEIDIIAKQQDGRIIFVEVKFRNTAKHGYPREAVTPEKQRKIRLVAEQYLRMKKLINAYTRFDVIEILNSQINHLQNAF